MIKPNSRIVLSSEQYSALSYWKGYSSCGLTRSGLPGRVLEFDFSESGKYW